MAVKTYTQDIECSVAASRMFKAICIDADNFYTMAMPEIMKSVEYVQGGCAAVGSVKLIKYVDEGASKCVKHKINEIDVEKSYYKYTIIEGDLLGDNVECIVVEEKIEATSTGCVVKVSNQFHTKGDGELDEEKLRIGKEKIIKTFKFIEEYLKANPETYA